MRRRRGGREAAVRPCTGRLVAGLALALALSQGAGAEPATTLAEAVEAAWRRSAQSAETAGQARRAAAERTAAAALWPSPPALEVGMTRDRQRPHGTTRETEVGVAMALWLPGQRSARVLAADADAAAASAFTAAARWRVAGAVREAAAEAVLQAAELAAAQVQGRELDALAEDVDRRVAAGDLARADALAAQAERLAAAGAVLQARQRLQAARLQWTALTGLGGLPALSSSAVAPGAIDEHPALQAAARGVERARGRLEVARTSRRDAPELVVRARQEVARGEPDTNGVGVALRIPFGGADRNAPLLAAALSELEIAEATERELRQQVEAGIAAARLAEQAARRQLADERSRAQLLRERATLVARSFEAGETALPDRLRALTAAAQAESALTRQHAVLAQAIARLQQALGVMP